MTATLQAKRPLSDLGPLRSVPAATRASGAEDGVLLQWVQGDPGVEDGLHQPGLLITFQVDNWALLDVNDARELAQALLDGADEAEAGDLRRVES